MLEEYSAMTTRYDLVMVGMGIFKCVYTQLQKKDVSIMPSWGRVACMYRNIHKTDSDVAGVMGMMGFKGICFMLSFPTNTKEYPMPRVG